MKPKIFTRVFIVLTSLLFVVVSVLAVELFRYRYHAENGREFEYVFQTDEQSTPKTVSDEKAADWVTSFTCSCDIVRIGAAADLSGLRGQKILKLADVTLLVRSPRLRVGRVGEFATNCPLKTLWHGQKIFLELRERLLVL
jgi:hypothetical protein